MRGEIDFVAGWRVARCCKKNEFNILHLHSAHALAIGLWAKLFHRELTLVAVRRVDFHINRRLFGRLKYRSTYVSRVVCISEAIRHVLLEDGLPPDKLVTIHSGIDLRSYAEVMPRDGFRVELGIPDNDLVIGTVAAMARHKDYPNLLRAAKLVLRTKEGVTFCAVGDGPERARILRLAKELGLHERFVFVGFQADPRSYLANFDVFVLASKKEGLGTALLEAQAVGLPVVACRTGGIPEIVQNGHNGLLVPPRNPTQLAAALLRLAHDSTLRDTLGRNALRTVGRFSIDTTVEGNTQLYATLLSQAA
jgi:glycosyltransferase involved in cell wall biosynthesis